LWRVGDRYFFYKLINICQKTYKNIEWGDGLFVNSWTHSTTKLQ
jgi:hypothetical protein